MLLAIGLQSSSSCFSYLQSKEEVVNRDPDCIHQKEESFVLSRRIGLANIALHRDLWARLSYVFCKGYSSYVYIAGRVSMS